MLKKVEPNRLTRDKKLNSISVYKLLVKIYSRFRNIPYIQRFIQGTNATHKNQNEKYDQYSIYNSDSLANFQTLFG